MPEARVSGCFARKEEEERGGDNTPGERQGCSQAAGLEGFIPRKPYQPRLGQHGGAHALYRRKKTALLQSPPWSIFLFTKPVIFASEISCFPPLEPTPKIKLFCGKFLFDIINH